MPDSIIESPRRGSALVTSVTVLFVVFIVGSGLISHGLQATRRGQWDVLRMQALSLAETGIETGIDFLRMTAPDGTTDGSWRTTGYTEPIAGMGEYSLRVEDGSASLAGKLIVTATGRASHPACGVARRSVRVVLELTRENVSVWANAVFAGTGQAGRAISGNVRIHGSVHMLGQGESFTDLDGDQQWDPGEAFVDRNDNRVYDLGERFTDADGDERRDAPEPFVDLNGNGIRDAPLTASDLASDLSGTAGIFNHYGALPAELRALLPAPPRGYFNGREVETLRARLRVRHGRVSLSGTAGIGEPSGGEGYKTYVDGAYVSDGFAGNGGADNVFSDNGTQAGYDLGDTLAFPLISEPVTRGGVRFDSYLDYLRAIGLTVPGELVLQRGTPLAAISDGRGNSLSLDASGRLVVRGVVVVDGDLEFRKGTGAILYDGRGTLASGGSISVSCDLLPVGGTFPNQHALGLIARHRIELATGNGDAHLSLAGAFYAQERIVSAKQNEIAGSLVSAYFSMQNVPRVYQVPTLAENLPPQMPGETPIWLKSLRVDSWREVSP